MCTNTASEINPQIIVANILYVFPAIITVFPGTIKWGTPGPDLNYTIPIVILWKVSHPV